MSDELKLKLERLKRQPDVNEFETLEYLPWLNDETKKNAFPIEDAKTDLKEFHATKTIKASNWKPQVQCLVECETLEEYLGWFVSCFQYSHTEFALQHVDTKLWYLLENSSLRKLDRQSQVFMSVEITRCYPIPKLSDPQIFYERIQLFHSFVEMPQTWDETSARKLHQFLVEPNNSQFFFFEPAEMKNILESQEKLKRPLRLYQVVCFPDWRTNYPNPYLYVFCRSGFLLVFELVQPAGKYNPVTEVTPTIGKLLQLQDLSFDSKMPVFRMRVNVASGFHGLVHLLSFFSNRPFNPSVENPNIAYFTRTFGEVMSWKRIAQSVRKFRTFLEYEDAFYQERHMVITSEARKNLNQHLKHILESNTEWAEAVMVRVRMNALLKTLGSKAFHDIFILSEEGGGAFESERRKNSLREEFQNSLTRAQAQASDFKFYLLPWKTAGHFYLYIICYPSTSDLGDMKQSGFCPVIWVLDSLTDSKEKITTLAKNWLEIPDEKTKQRYVDFLSKLKLSKTHQENVPHVHEFLRLAGIRKMNDPELPVYNALVPQQGNSHGCGFFMIEFMERFIRDPFVYTDIRSVWNKTTRWFEDSKTMESNMRCKLLSNLQE